MFFELKVAIRFLKYGRSQTVLILCGIAIGVAVQVFLASLISGLQEDLINKTVGNTSHITAKKINFTPVSSYENTSDLVLRSFSETYLRNDIMFDWKPIYEELKKVSNIISTVPFADGPAFVAKGDKNLAVLIRGTNIDESDKIYNFSQRLIAGNFKADAGEILLGVALAKELGLEQGSILRLTASKGASDVFRVSGIFDLSNDSINKSWIIMDINRAQKLLAFNGGISSIEMQTNDPFLADSIKADVKGRFLDNEFQTWQEANKQLLTALSSQSSSSNIIQVFVLLAVALGISSVLAVSVMQKSKQIGILKAMGAKNSDIGTIFQIQGGILGLAGSIIGCFIGYVLVKLFMYFTSNSGTSFPINLSTGLLAFSIGIATFIGLFAAFIPARNSSKLSAIEVIRNG